MIAPSNEELLVSVVIPTYNRADLVRVAVERLWDQTLPVDQWEIIIADNCSTDDTPAVVAALATRSPVPVKRRRLERNGGPACSRNAGAEVASGRYIAFIDSDVRLDPVWLERAVAYANADPSIGILSGKLVFGSRPDVINAFGGAMSRIGLGWDNNDNTCSSSIVDAVDSLWVATAAVLIPRSLFDRLDGFDGEYYYAYEDSDFGWRVNLAGYRCRCVPDLIAYHHIGPHRHASRDPIITFHSCKNRLRSLLKNYGPGRLLAYLPVYLLYACADCLLRPPRWQKLRALWWNVGAFRATMRLRADVQRARVRSDAELDPLFAPGWFPDMTVDARNHRQTELLAGDSHETPDVSY